MLMCCRDRGDSNKQEAEIATTEAKDKDRMWTKIVRGIERIRTQIKEKLASGKNHHKQNMEGRFATLESEQCHSSEKLKQLAEILDDGTESERVMLDDDTWRKREILDDDDVDDCYHCRYKNIPETIAPPTSPASTSSISSISSIPVTRRKKNLPESFLPSVQTHLPEARSATEYSISFPTSTWPLDGSLVRLEISPKTQRDKEQAKIEWNIGNFPHECQQEERKHFKSNSFKFAGASWHLFISLDRKKFYSMFGINIRTSRSSDMFFKCESRIEFYDKSLFKPVKILHCNFECRDADSYGLVGNFFSDSELNTFLNQGYLIKCEIDVLKSSSSAVKAHTLSEFNDVYGMSQDMKDLLLSEEESDVTIQVGDQQFKAHRIILMARSSVFAAMFHHDSKEKATGVVNVEDCDPSSFPVFLEFLYSGSTDKLSAENVFSLYRSADKFDVQSLKRECFQFIKLNLSVDTFCETVRLSLQHSEADLLELFADFFVSNFEKIISKPEWEACKLENLKKLNEILLEACCQLTSKSEFLY